MIANVNTVAKMVLGQTEFASDPTPTHALRAAFGCIGTLAAAQTHMYRN